MNMEEALSKISLGEYFTAYEFCNKQDGFAIEVPKIDLFKKLDMLRKIVGEITLTSGYRTSSFNKSVGGSSNSYHLEGLAADIRFDFSMWTIESIKMLVSGIGFSNLGIYLNKNGTINRLHVDVGIRWASWDKFREMSFKIYHV